MSTIGKRNRAAASSAESDKMAWICSALHPIKAKPRSFDSGIDVVIGTSASVVFRFCNARPCSGRHLASAIYPTLGPRRALHATGLEGVPRGRFGGPPPLLFERKLLMSDIAILMRCASRTDFEAIVADKCRAHATAIHRRTDVMSPS